MPRKLTGVPQVTEWVTSTDAAEMLGVTRQSVNKTINQGKFKTLHLMGRTYVIKRSELESMLAEKNEKEAESERQEVPAG